MTTDELLTEWKNYKITHAERAESENLSDLIYLCAKFPPIPGTLYADTGGPQGAEAYIIKMHDDGETLLAVNPENPTETRPLGKLSRRHNEVRN